MFGTFVAAGVPLLSWSGVAFAHCEAPREVLDVLDRSSFRLERGLTKAERDAKRIAFLERALTHHPHDFLLGRWHMPMEGSNLFLEGVGSAAQRPWAEPCTGCMFGDQESCFPFPRPRVPPFSPLSLRVISRRSRISSAPTRIRRGKLCDEDLV
jgi:hypothetical protein